MIQTWENAFMSYKGRALYNLIQMNLKRNPELQVVDWQVEDYSALSTEQLLNRLEMHQIFIDEEHFILYARESDSPEDLTDLLYVGKDLVAYEKSFLCLFELWRRLCPHKQSLSLFCDELDHLIEAYEEGDMEYEDQLQAELLSLQRILDDNVDEGGNAEEGFKMLSDYSCHALDLFIYEYIAHQLDLENNLYASELIEGFYPYMQSKRWFEFLRIRTVSAVDLQEGKMMIERLLESLQEDLDLQLLFEVLHFLVYIGANDQFIASYHLAMRNLETEDDLRELMRVLGDYFSYFDQDKEEEIIDRLLEKRKGKRPTDPVDLNDDFLEVLKNLLAPLQS